MGHRRGRRLRSASNGACAIRATAASRSRSAPSAPSARAATRWTSARRRSTSAIGRAPEALADLPAPDAVFIGGGASEAGVFEAAWTALKPGGRLVINARHAGDRDVARRALRAAWRHDAAPGGLAPRTCRRHAWLARGDARHAMGGDEAMIVAGIGFRRSVAADEIVALVELRAGACVAHARCIGTDSRPSTALADAPAFTEAARTARRDRDAGRAEQALPRRHRASARNRPAPSRRTASARSRKRRRSRPPALDADLILERIASACATCALARLETRAMTVHFIGAGPGAADLITVRGPLAHRALPRLPLCRLHRAAGDAVLVPARCAARRHRAARSRRDHGGVRAGA